MRVTSAHIGHETNTFSTVPTTLDDFKLGNPVPDFSPGEPILRAFADTGTIHGGFIDAAREDGFTLEPLLWAWANPGGIVEQSAYETLKGLLLGRIAEAGPFDGILLDLHGAMVTEDLEDAEGDLLHAVRELVGPNVPVYGTLDLHANVTPLMAEKADVLIGFDEYPHIDMRERGLEAGKLMAAALRGERHPVCAYHQLPLLSMPPKQCTYIEPMKSLLSHAHAIEAEPGILNVSLILGFPFADIHDAGMSVLVTSDGDAALAKSKAAEMAEAIWVQRDAFMPDLVPVSQAIEIGMQAENGPVVLADGSDNPGGGGPCDGTVALRELIRVNARNAVVAVIADPESVAASIETGVGNSVSLTLGGKTDDRHGAPVDVSARVRLISDGSFVQTGPMSAGVRMEMGRSAVVEIDGPDGIEVIVTERRIQPYDAALLRSVGIEPTERKIIVLKSAVHFRSTFQAMASRIIDLNTPGIHRPDFNSYPYKQLRQPLYPLDRDFQPDF